MPKSAFFSQGSAYILCSLALCGASGATESNKVPEHRLDPTGIVASYLACLDDHNITLVSAHRGGPGPGFPENALESLQHATDYGPVLLEVDVRETADGHLVLLHDDTLPRTSNGSGKLAEHTLAQLTKLRLKDPDGKATSFAIPTLNEVLAWAKDRTIVQLDVKRGVDYAKVAQAVVDADAVDSALLIAYRLEDAQRALKIHPGFSFSLSISEANDLDKLDQSGISRGQVLAWTGVAQGEEIPIWNTLETLEVLSAAGAFWTLENQMLVDGNTQPYLELAKAGVDVIGSDHYRMAYDTLAGQQQVAPALQTCKGK